MACSPLSNFQFSLGWVLLACTVFLAYAPQWIKQWRRKSHIGMSLSNFLCATLVAFLQLLNYLCCQSQDTFKCCRGSHTIRQCLAALQPLMQAASACICYVIVVALYFIFFDVQGLVSRGRDGSKEFVFARRKLLVATVILAALILALVALLWATGWESAIVWRYGIFNEVVASVILLSHWLLQMWETWSLQSVGSLSVFSLIIGCIGNLLNAYSFGVHGGFAVAASNLVAGIMIGCTCALAGYVEMLERRRAADPLARSLSPSRVEQPERSHEMGGRHKAEDEKRSTAESLPSSGPQ